MSSNKTVTMSRELAETILSELTSGAVSVSTGAKLRALLAAPAVERQEPVVIDLDAVDWETIQQAADESNWMPNEYMRNEWVADVCNFLKYGRADTSPPAPVAVVLPSDKDVRDLVRQSAKEADLIQGANYYTAAEFAAEALLDKVKELNQ